MSGRETIVCTGYARLPDGMTAKEVFGTLGVVLEVDPATGMVVDVACTLVTRIGRKFIASLLLGRSLTDEVIDGAVEAVEKRFFGIGKKAIIAAIRDVYTQYKTFELAREMSKSQSK